MFSAVQLTALTTLLLTATAAPTPADSPLITIHNTGKSAICYKIEFSAGHFPTSTTCDSSPGILVPAGKTTTLHATADFNGGITAITNGIKGARHEINFSETGTWYDVDYQLGMSDSTLGPADHRPRANGDKNSLAGEQDTLAKANAAWGTTGNKADLLQHGKYIRQGKDGKLSHVYMDAGAPEVVVEFFQLKAGFGGYVGAGSVGGGDNGGEMVRAADMKSWSVGTRRMEIVAY